MVDVTAQDEPYRLWVNAERTVLVRIWPDGHAEIALRDTSDHIWGPPIPITETATQ